MTAAVRKLSATGGFWAAAAALTASAGEGPEPANCDGISETPAWMRGMKPPPGARLLPQIKLMVLIARRPDISSDEFHRYWLENHAALALSVADEVRLQRYVQSHEVPSVIAEGYAGTRGWTPNIFEGVTEAWWNSEQDMIEAFSTPAGMAISQRLVEDENRFCDQRCVGIIMREYAIFDRDRNRDGQAS